MNTPSAMQCFQLVAALTLAATLPGGASRAAGDPTLGPPEAQTLARDLFRQVIEINTTAQVGSTRAAEAMAARLRQAGFAAADLTLTGPHPQNQNLVIRYRGRTRERPILFIAHLDVVEALASDWSFDPFTFRQQDGFFYGRGTTDMKCEVADIVENLIRLRREGYVPRRDLIIALTEHEENGDANGIAWLLSQRRDLIDAEFAINLEGGGGNSKAGKPMLMEIQTSEKTYLNFQLEVRNKGGHSSLPTKDNAMVRMAGALSRVGAMDLPVRLNETTRMYFGQYAKVLSEPIAAEMRAIAENPANAAAAARLSAASPYYNALLRTTCVPTLVSGGHAENALPQSVRVNINCRLLPDESPAEVKASLERTIADPQVLVTTQSQARPSPLSPLRPDIVQTVNTLTQKMWPGVVVTAVMSTGASDGKQLRQAGIPVYGVSGMFGDVDDVRAHGRDERIGVQDFYRGVEFMYRFIPAIAGR
jgi:acetylornithine deacetylase/succinyl-diaminopimelate desuccinylase-like protein